jgi:hypothetical protein
VETDYYYWDPHFSPHGHAVYADFLTRHLTPLIISQSTIEK